MEDIAEATKVVEVGDKEKSAPTQKDTQQWTLYVDGSSNENGSGAGMMLISLEDTKYIVPCDSNSRHQTKRPNMRPS